jgi:DNA repair exonuclease SbcCD ATPase subunit
MTSLPTSIPPLEQMMEKWRNMTAEDLSTQLQVWQNRAKNLNATMHSSQKQGCAARSNHRENWLKACQLRDECRRLLQDAVPPKQQKQLKNTVAGTSSSSKTPTLTVGPTDASAPSPVAITPTAQPCSSSRPSGDPPATASSTKRRMDDLEDKRKETKRSCLTCMENQITMLKMDKMQKELDELRAARDVVNRAEAEKEVQTLKAQVQKLEQSLAEQTKQKGEVVKLCNKYRQSVQAAKTVNDRLTEANEKLHKTIADAVKDSNAKINDLTAKKSDLAQSNNRLQKEANALHEQLKDSLAKLDTYETEVVDAKMKLINMEDKVKSMELEITVLNQKYDKIKVEHDTHLSRVDQLGDDLLLESFRCEQLSDSYKEEVSNAAFFKSKADRLEAELARLTGRGN